MRRLLLTTFLVTCVVSFLYCWTNAATSQCTGDCDASGAVTIDELVLMVNVALGTQPLSICTAGDRDGSGDITIDEIIVAVVAALGDCSTQPTPVPTAPACDGSLLCSAGPEDSNCCSSDDECAPGGACVVTYGVCNGGDFDGYPCDCPGGTCVGSTCQGGPYDGESCTATEGSGNCSAGITCAGTSHICLAGDYKAYPCLRNSNCTNDNGTPETCGSTGLFCDGGDFDGSSCVDAADCTGTGSNGCVAPAP